MTRQMLLRMMIGVTLSVLLLLACDMLQSESTPDRVATDVAEAKAIAATLTAEAPTAVPTRLPMEIPRPMSTPTPTPLPTSVSTTLTPTPVTASMNTAIVTGVLIYGDTGKRLEQGKKVRLVQVDEVEGKTTLIFGGVKDPIAETQADGTFVISNVPTGKYAVIVHGVGGLYAQVVSSSGSLILITFDKGGRAIDLGVIRVVAP